MVETHANYAMVKTFVECECHCGFECERKLVVQSHAFEIPNARRDVRTATRMGSEQSARARRVCVSEVERSLYICAVPPKGLSFNILFLYRSQRRSLDLHISQADTVAAGLRALGVQRGSHVGLWGVNTPEWLLSHAGALRAGALLANLHPGYRPAEIEYTLNLVCCF